MTGMFYRIENENKEGPYNYGSDWQERDHNHSEISPTPCKDKYKKGVGYDGMCGKICGFKSIKQLEQWFCDQELNNLEAQGFHIILVEGENATIFERQVIFDRIEENAA